MASIPFKLSRGAEANIPVELTDGHMYFCYDTGNLYIDCQDELGTIQRVQLSSEWADKVRYEENGTTISIDASELATKTYVDNAENVWYGTCTTSGSTTSKVVNTINGNFQLKEGAICFIKFSNNHTASGSFTIDIDGTGAKSVTNYSYHAPATTSIYCVIYDGTNYRATGEDFASTSQYGIVKLSSSTSSTSNSLAATASAVRTAYNRATQCLSKSGGIMTGAIILPEGAPTEDYEAVYKKYVDDAVSGVITTAAQIVRW